MRTTLPGPFTARFSGPDGPYAVSFTPLNETDHGRLDVSLNGVAMRWWVQRADVEADSSVSIGGMTEGAQQFWQDEFWFELVVGPGARTITYWGDQVLVRVDQAM
jgi:hypothetical protein